jgi:ribosomal protein S18 acetylase RimI-like enzyme
VTIEIREARPEEHDEAGRVTAAAHREFARPGETVWEEYLDRIADAASRARVATILVALDGDRIVGSATLELGERVDDDDPPLRPDEAHVRMLGVHPEARRRGVAAALLADIEDRARRAGRSRITLHTTPRMRPAQMMYERLGYRRLVDRVFPDGFVLLTYERMVAGEG